MSERISANRYLELKEQLAQHEARLTAIEESADAGALLAEEIGSASLRALQRHALKPKPLRGTQPPLKGT